MQKNAKKLKQSKLDEWKALAEEYETKLKEKQNDQYTRFKYKLWVAAGTLVCKQRCLLPEVSGQLTCKHLY